MRFWPGEQEIGEITSAAVFTKGGRPLALGYVQRDYPGGRHGGGGGSGAAAQARVRQAGD